MVDRHLNAISKTVGFDIRPDENFTLKKVEEKGLLKHTKIWKVETFVITLYLQIL